jgi:ribose transport system permease protein
VLATFDFGSIQAFITQLFYGLILVLSLLLTLLVPAVGRHLSFVSPFGAFIVLGAIVMTIMLQVATSETYVTAPPSPVEHGADLVSRYLLLPPPGIERATLALTQLQKIVFAAAGTLVLFTLAMRVATVEAMSLRLGAFLYVVIGTLIIFLFVVIGGHTHGFGYARGLGL